MPLFLAEYVFTSFVTIQEHETVGTTAVLLPL